MSKHSECVDDLVKRLLKKPYISSIVPNKIYKQGECDLFVTYTDGRIGYWEVKSTHTEKTHQKASKQLLRWYLNTDYEKKVCVYYSPSKTAIMYYDNKDKFVERYKNGTNESTKKK